MSYLYRDKAFSWTFQISSNIKLPNPPGRSNIYIEQLSLYRTHNIVQIYALAFIACNLTML